MSLSRFDQNQYPPLSKQQYLPLQLQPQQPPPAKLQVSQSIPSSTMPAPSTIAVSTSNSSFRKVLILGDITSHSTNVPPYSIVQQEHKQQQIHHYTKQIQQQQQQQQQQSSTLTTGFYKSVTKLEKPIQQQQQNPLSQTYDPLNQTIDATTKTQNILETTKTQSSSTKVKQRIFNSPIRAIAAAPGLSSSSAVPLNQPPYIATSSSNYHTAGSATAINERTLPLTPTSSDALNPPHPPIQRKSITQLKKYEVPVSNRIQAQQQNYQQSHQFASRNRSHEPSSNSTTTRTTRRDIDSHQLHSSNENPNQTIQQQQDKQLNYDSQHRSSHQLKQQASGFYSENHQKDQQSWQQNQSMEIENSQGQSNHALRTSKYQRIFSADAYSSHPSSSSQRYSQQISQGRQTQNITTQKHQLNNNSDEAIIQPGAAAISTSLTPKGNASRIQNQSRFNTNYESSQPGNPQKNARNPPRTNDIRGQQDKNSDENMNWNSTATRQRDNLACNSHCEEEKSAMQLRCDEYQSELLKLHEMQAIQEAKHSEEVEELKNKLVLLTAENEIYRIQLSESHTRIRANLQSEIDLSLIESNDSLQKQQELNLIDSSSNQEQIQMYLRFFEKVIDHKNFVISQTQTDMKQAQIQLGQYADQILSYKNKLQETQEATKNLQVQLQQQQQQQSHQQQLMLLQQSLQQQQQVNNNNNNSTLMQSPTNILATTIMTATASTNPVNSSYDGNNFYTYRVATPQPLALEKPSKSASTNLFPPKPLNKTYSYSQHQQQQQQQHQQQQLQQHQQLQPHSQLQQQSFKQQYASTFTTSQPRNSWGAQINSQEYLEAQSMTNYSSNRSPTFMSRAY